MTATDVPVQRKHENDEYAAMLRRMIRSYGARVGEGDPYDLGDMFSIAELLDRELHSAVTRLRERDYSWGNIAEATGLTRQACQQRFGRRARTA